jgi:hypothetical protein
MFTLYGAEFSAKRVEIQLQPLSLAGGIRDIWMSARHVVPEGCALDYEIQVNGVWYPLSQAHTALAGTPALVGFRAVATCTRDIAPTFTEKTGAVTVSRPATDLVHFGATITPPAPTSTFKVVAIVHGFDGGDHTLALSLISGVTEEAADSTVIEDTPDGRAKKYTFNFSTASPLSDFQVKTVGTCTAGAAPFSVSEITAHSA